MAFPANVCKTTGLFLLVIALLVSCKKGGGSSDSGNNSGNPGGGGSNTASLNADSLSNHLQFFSASKVQGTAPKASGGSTLRISFKDTLYLVDQVKLPIKFLHMDTTQHVKGVFIQVMGLSGGSLAGNYYDVPAVPQVDTTSDTVSVVMIGIDPTNIQLPFTFDITITPHGSDGKPIVQIIRPVKIIPHHSNPTPSSSSCGIVLPGSLVWEWECSYINGRPGSGNAFDFYDDPNTVFNKSGQMIGGSCCNGNLSIYGLCPGERKPNRSLHFATYYQITEERLLFFDQGNYFRFTQEDAPTPYPDISNFCAGGEGVVKPNLTTTSYNGNFTISPATLPVDLQALKDSFKVSLVQTSASGTGGFGNGGGIIHHLDCHAGGELILIQVDPEGFGQHLYRCYRAMFPDDVRWYAMN